MDASVKTKGRCSWMRLATIGAACVLALSQFNAAAAQSSSAPVSSGPSCTDDYDCVTLVAGTTLIQFDITWQGYARQVLIISPTVATTTKAPALVILHGTSMPPALMANVANASQLAATTGMWVIVPDAHGDWNTSPNQSSGNDDVGFLSSLITTVVAQYPINPKKVSMSGFSRGAFLTEVMACEAPDQLASAAIVSGTMTAPDIRACTPDRPLPILYIMGTADPKVDYDGAYGQDSASQDFSYWTGMLGCDDTQVKNKNLPTTVNDGTTVALESDASCTAGGVVELYTVTGGGHAWPGSTVPNPETLGVVSQNLDATTVIGAFAAKWTTASTQ